jgi:hypothetical protein
MTSLPVRHERRAAQRFDFHLPVSIKLPDAGLEGVGFTQNLSARGAFFYADCPIPEGSEVELTFMMPSEITLAENMRVRCRARVLRVLSPAGASKTGIAVQLAGYEFLPAHLQSAEIEGAFGRISSLHEHRLGSE